MFGQTLKVGSFVLKPPKNICKNLTSIFIWYYECHESNQHNNKHTFSNWKNSYINIYTNIHNDTKTIE